MQRGVGVAQGVSSFRGLLEILGDAVETIRVHSNQQLSATRLNRTILRLHGNACTHVHTIVHVHV